MLDRRAWERIATQIVTYAHPLPAHLPPLANDFGWLRQYLHNIAGLADAICPAWARQAAVGAALALDDQTDQAHRAATPQYAAMRADPRRVAYWVMWLGQNYGLVGQMQRRAAQDLAQGTWNHADDQ